VVAQRPHAVESGGGSSLAYSAKFLTQLVFRRESLKVEPDDAIETGAGITEPYGPSLIILKVCGRFRPYLAGKPL
jgi:hypothetical protein